MRLRHKPWADDYIAESTHIVTPKPFEQKGEWNKVFDESQPLALEIGTGKGQFIAGMAEKNPSVNFIGMERAKSVIVSAIQKVDEAGVKNARLIHENAKDLREMFGSNEVDTIYLNFSDPWPKTRHEKRRLTFHTFLEQYKDVLKPDGEVILKTDNQHLFEYSLVSFSQYGMKLEEVVLDLHALDDETNVMTEYEEKFSNKGQRIYRCIAKFQ
ncbi:tRNA (guanosine(46)-N7)-methyltransferase TrmB [Halalkalibacillus sediminis]|uniref:tRNA (guanine-N(7)-)-methyltransferase n=1 Tax=Halalkalibacillus sediminis TaxID=2018042 RepID=A0A2I0QYB7_9BACI|nr:tRNA (guanosine(46)-N7)-methyltransferase TrmB [Halalkalibacillus sediminis]PKR79331.1 tRNA (guanosine(46)-N7)-methyltransferase TrmB [Halalkalibacillus sediminis]